MKALYVLSVVAIIVVVIAAASADDWLGAVVLFALGLVVSLGFEFALIFLAVRARVSPTLFQNLLAVSGVALIPVLTFLLVALVQD